MSRRRSTGGRGVVERFLSPFASGAGYINLNPPVGSIGNATFDVTGGALEDLWTLASHGLRTGDRIQFTAVGTGAEPFVVDTDYWVVKNDANTFQLAATLDDAEAGTIIEGTGSDSSGTWTVALQAMTYRAGPTGDEVWGLIKVRLHLEDGTTAFDADDFGALAALTNGISLRVGETDGTVLKYLLGEDANGAEQATIKDNAHFSDHAQSAILSEFTGGDQSINVIFEYGDDLILEAGQEFQLYVNDDLSGLDDFNLKVQGVVL